MQEKYNSKNNFLNCKNRVFLCFKKKFKTEIYQKLHFGKLVKINFIFRFYLPIFFLISYSAYFSMQHCFERYVLREMFYTFLISTFRISYIIFHHRNIIFYLFSSKFFRNMCVIHKQRCLGHRFRPKIKQIL